MSIASCTSLIKSFDFFGESFTFKIKRNKYYTSIVGGITTIAFLVYTVYYLSFSFKDFVNRNNRTVENEIRTEFEPVIQFNDHPYFMMAFCLRDSSIGTDSYLTSNTLMKAELINNSIDNKRLIEKPLELQLHQCQSSHFQDVASDIYYLKDFNGCGCLNMTEQSFSDGSLRSKYDVVDKEYINFKISPKLGTNITQFNTYLQEGKSRLFVYFPTYSVEMSNTSYPLKMNLQTQIYEMRPFSQQISDIQISVLNFSDYTSLSDSGKLILF